MKEVQKLENRNRILHNEIAQLNTGKQTAEEQKRIDGNFEGIEINNDIISELKKSII